MALNLKKKVKSTRNVLRCNLGKVSGFLGGGKGQFSFLDCFSRCIHVGKTHVISFSSCKQGYPGGQQPPGAPYGGNNPYGRHPSAPYVGQPSAGAYGAPGQGGPYAPGPRAPPVGPYGGYGGQPQGGYYGQHAPAGNYGLRGS